MVYITVIKRKATAVSYGSICDNWVQYDDFFQLHYRRVANNITAKIKWWNGPSRHAGKPVSGFRLLSSCSISELAERGSLSLLACCTIGCLRAGSNNLFSSAVVQIACTEVFSMLSGRRSYTGWFTKFVAFYNRPVKFLYSSRARVTDWQKGAADRELCKVFCHLSMGHYKRRQIIWF
jgi:hypothetical protein